jgi:hypothetical protein
MNKPSVIGLARKSIILAIGAVVLSGCSSQPEYRCSIPEACAPVHENYDLATKDETKDGWVSEGADPSLPPGVEPKEEESSQDEDDDGWFSGWFSSDSEEERRAKLQPVMSGEVDVHSGPVFVPPRPHRIWLAHWKGEAGELNSGNYTYLTTPGYYHYMGEKYLALPYGVESGQSAQAETFNGIPRATFSPVRPDDLGFDAVESDTPTGVLDGMVQPTEGDQ